MVSPNSEVQWVRAFTTNPLVMISNHVGDFKFLPFPKYFERILS